MSGEGVPPVAPGPMACDQDSRWKQYLEDERIALFLQNEEFMKELQRNRDFLLALERDRLKYESQKSKSSNVAVGSDVGFPSSVPGKLAVLRESLMSSVGPHLNFFFNVENLGVG